MARDASGTIERLYALNAGIAVAPDRAVYAPDRPSGEPMTLSCNCYLLRRAGEWILWDTGTDDAIYATSGGRIIAHDLRGMVLRTIASQLDDIGLSPSSVSTVILSHGHFDHVGNARLFPHARWIMQRREHAAMFGADHAKYGYTPELYDVLRRARVDLLDGDSDLFGDGSVRVIATPGHTPGHSSLLVRLAKAGPILLSADVAHFRENFDARRVPPMNSSAEETRASMDKIGRLMEVERAQLWLNHDIVQNATIPHAPAYFE